MPLEGAVLRGIDAAFDKYDARKAKTRVRRINGLARCSQEVMAAVEAMKEATIGAQPNCKAGEAAPGLERDRIAAHLRAVRRNLERRLCPAWRPRLRRR